ncbi:MULTISPECIES: helix-turn-helix transcriptional regulator [unclassified Streptomyces]|jgi:DNA-binding Xre family transcriptional regulator|uniref:helix-turn-helix domain-containing protein n=1 Tax=unclassified Streptomyces TaxID=2593676 RepID=UPI0008DC8A14|nr:MULTISPECIES: helix-turn-helix transcriptional regulator [unclassified Streptomyces]OII69613.1 XRE family transcriptional regulator [Streptomyces sp. CC77]
MTSKLDYNWHLRELMALRGMYSTTDLRPLLIERDVNLSASQVYRLVTEKPERLSMKTLMALIDILSCRMDELIEPVAAAAPVRRAAGASDAGADLDRGVGEFRPRRARVTRDPK